MEPVQENQQEVNQQKLNSFPCMQGCNLVFTSPNKRLNHYNSLHEKSVTCKICYSQFPDTENLQVHKRIKHSNDHHQIIRCDACSIIFKDVNLLYAHMTVHRENFPECYICGGTFANQQAMEKHMESHSFNHPLDLSKIHPSVVEKSNTPVDGCPKIAFGSEDAVTGNKEKESEHYRSEPSSIEDISVQGQDSPHSSGQNLESKKDTDPSESTGQKIKEARKTKRVCQYCGESVSSMSELVSHVEKTHTCITYKCTLCQIEIIDRAKLEEHFISHKGEVYDETTIVNPGTMDIEKPEYICNKCGKVFVNKTKLRTHKIQIHYFTCETCGKTLSNQLSWKTHMDNNHTPFNCAICKKTYVGKLALQSHESKDHALYECKACKLKFKKVEMYKLHMLLHVDENSRKVGISSKVVEKTENSLKTQVSLSPQKIVSGQEDTFLCTQCGKIFHYQSSLQMHERIHGRK
ncbi:hypothetical protein CHS0354_021022 [Potamilus streckersoni]|uniref:Zinc finger protein n=1 Tax=Potamilus streckersoni TaxID=2493646 RepID=A0AAE0VZK2_9BIVA|nr:hypothetical protein CHS0354_021022 [Potamilus streckersoni]